MKTQYLKIIKKTFLLIFSILYVFMIVKIVLGYFKLPKFLIQTDVVSFLTGAKIINEGKQANLYDLETQFEYQNKVVYPETKKLLPFRNFPVTAFLYQPLLKMNLRDSYFTVFIANIVLLLTFHILYKRNFSVMWGGLAFLIPILFYPSVNSLIVGQFSPLLLIFFTFLYIFLLKEKDFLGGIVMSLLLLKPQLLLFIPFSLVIAKNKKRFLGGFLLGAFIFVTINLLIIKWVWPVYDYFNFIRDTESASFGSRPYQMNTFYGLMSQLKLSLDPIWIYLINVALYLLVVFRVYFKERSFSKKKIFVLGVIATIFFSIHALNHDLVLFLLPLYITLGNTKSSWLVPALWLVAISLLLSSSLVTSLVIGVVLIFFLFHGGKNALMSK